MKEKMKEALQKSIKVNAEKASDEETKADEALKFTQAVLNATHALNIIENG